MKDRIKKNYDIDIDIYTFHALGRKIIQEETQKKPKLLFNQSFDKNQYILIEQLFGEALKDREYQNILIEYLAYHIEQVVDEESFADKEEYYKYMKNKKYSTLNGLEVKSIAERDIANFLFIHNIDFKYEPLVEWVDESDEDKEYHPDFYLTEYDIYIEHWGLDENNNVPPWFSKSPKEYLELRKWKLFQFKKYQEILVETWDYENKRNELIPNLKKKLLEINSKIEFIQLTYKELVERTHEYKEKRNEIVNLIVNFIKIAKSNYYNDNDIEHKLESKKYTKKQNIFGQLALEVFRQYQKYLKAEDKIDFNDMINNAVQYVEKIPQKYQNMYDQLLVDEFQDISYQRLQLIKGFVNENSNTKLFCVGDDWQSIYQFTGSDVRFFTNFDEFFANPEITYLKTNYRSSVRIVDLSNELISKNKDQMKKIINANKAIGQQPLFFELSRRFAYGFKSQIPHVYELVRKLVDEGVKPKKIMVLSRFNKFLRELEIYCGARGIPTEYKEGGVRFYSAHSAKGSECKHVILTDITSGLYGFPCEIQDSSVMEVAKRFKTQKYIEEERRLFYVAVTRSKKYLYLYSIEGNNSIFLDEIKPHIMKIHVDDLPRWEQVSSEIIPNFLREQEIKTLKICPECGRFLEERKGKYGLFIGCTGFPNCRYAMDIKNEKDILCPRCGRRLVIRSGKYGIFLGCISFPRCRFAFNPWFRKKEKIFCPVCRKKLKVFNTRLGSFLRCSTYPKCQFTFDL
ncbi:MAG: topoisomerase DNA-binding C4 zinc finger domain-containing protein, partial [Candidatus Hodarchaeota archaeon]